MSPVIPTDSNESNPKKHESLNVIDTDVMSADLSTLIPEIALKIRKSIYNDEIK